MKNGWIVALCLSSFLLGSIVASGSPTRAQSGGSLPTSCSSGEIVVSDGFDRFRCVALDDLIGTSGCGDGDLVTATRSGGLRCGTPSHCSTPAVLGLDSFGDLECLPPPGR